MFQVKKSNQSKKVSRMLDKERRKKAKEERNQEKNRNGDRQEKDRNEDDSTDGKTSKPDNIQTEIRTDDFVVSFYDNKFIRIRYTKRFFVGEKTDTF